MFVSLGKLILYVFLAFVAGLITNILTEGGGGLAIKGTKKYNKYKKESDIKVKTILKNGSGSSKQELQNWWDTYHK